MEAWRIFIVIALLLVLSSCKTVKRSSSQSSQSTRTETEAILTNRELKVETLNYGDTLQGLIPIRIPRGSDPITIPVESGGIALELTLTDSTVGYRAVAKPVARSQLSYGESKTEDRRRETEERSEQASDVEKKSRGFPWWIWVVVILAAALAVARFLLKIKLPF